jgi:hypothetical protein
MLKRAISATRLRGLRRTSPVLFIPAASSADLLRILIREWVAPTSVLGAAATTARNAAEEPVRGWSSCPERIFQVDVIKCIGRGGSVREISMITDALELYF